MSQKTNKQSNNNNNNNNNKTHLLFFKKLTVVTVGAEIRYIFDNVKLFPRDQNI